MTQTPPGNTADITVLVLEQETTRPISGAEVAVVVVQDGASARAWLHRGHTDDDGRCTLVVAVEGAVRVHTVARATGRRELWQPRGRYEPSEQRLVQRGDSITATHALEKGTTLVGVVVDARGAPVANATLELTQQARTGAAGRMHFALVAAEQQACAGLPR